MKQVIFIAVWACLGAFVTHQALADDYEQSEQYQTTKAANESLKRIKEGDV